MTHQMPSADADSSTAHSVHASVGATSEAADAWGAQRSALLGCRLAVRPAHSNCVLGGHHVLLKRSTARGLAKRVRAAAAGWLDAVQERSAPLRTGAATQLTAIARRAARQRTCTPPARSRYASRSGAFAFRHGRFLLTC